MMITSTTGKGQAMNEEQHAELAAMIEQVFPEADRDDVLDVLANVAASLRMTAEQLVKVRAERDQAVRDRDAAGVALNNVFRERDEARAALRAGSGGEPPPDPPGATHEVQHVMRVRAYDGSCRFDVFSPHTYLSLDEVRRCEWAFRAVRRTLEADWPDWPDDDDTEVTPDD